MWTAFIETKPFQRVAEEVLGKVSEVFITESLLENTFSATT